MVHTADPSLPAPLRRRLLHVALLAAPLFASLAACGKVSPQDDDRVLAPPTYAAESAMTAVEVDILVRRAAECVDSPNLVVAVVDRVGRPLGLWQRNAAATDRDRNIALSIARTGAFMSSSQGPITSRTLAAISTFHFPATFGALTDRPVPFIPTGAQPEFVLDPTLPLQHATTGVNNTGQGPLWQIYSCNRGAPYAGADLPVQTSPPTDFAPPPAGSPFSSMRLPPAGRINPDGSLAAHDAPGVGLSYLAGGIPAYKGGRVMGGVGVYIPNSPGSAECDDQLAEFVAIRALGGIRADGSIKGLANFGQPRSALAADEDLNFFFPYEIVPPQGLIYLVGVLLPYTQTPARPAGVLPGAFQSTNYVVNPVAGGDQPFGYLIGPRADPDASGLTEADVRRIIEQGVRFANGTRAAIRVPLGTPTKMVFAVTNRRGLILAAYRMEDAPVFSYDVAITKARCVTYLSSCPNGNPAMDPLDRLLLNAAGIPTTDNQGFAITTRTLGFLTQPFFPPGIGGNQGPGPLFRLVRDNAVPSNFDRMANAVPTGPGLQSGLIFFPGATSLWKGGQLVGGFGVSGDGVEQDDFVTDGGSRGFEAPVELRADQFVFQGTRLPYYKFPQITGPGGG
jgi:uncharacterized protein GlcG (DUF336 family)